MKKRKQKGRSVPLLILIFLIAAVAGVTVWIGIRASEPLPEEAFAPAATAPLTLAEQTESKSLWSTRFQTDLVEISRKDSILKVDAVTPGLDTCSVESTLYDLESGEALGAVSLPEGAWQTGLTQNGFYTLETDRKTVFLYEDNGKKVLEKVFSGADDWSPASAVSFEADQVAFVDAKTSLLHILSLEDEKEAVCQAPFAVREILGFENGCVTVLGVEGATAVIRTDTFETKTVADDPRCLYRGKDFSLGMTQHSFVCVGAEKTVYLPFFTFDELVVGLGRDAFATTVLREEGTLVRIYSMDKETLYAKKMEKNVAYVLPGETDAIAITGEPGKYRVEKWLLSDTEKYALTLSKEETTKAKPTVTIEAASPARSSKIIQGVPLIAQFPEYPTGCESVSAVMALRYAGENVRVDTFVADYLPQSAEYYVKDGKKYGPSPYEVFIGTPTSSHSYGCMAPVIERALRQYFGKEGVVKNTTGTDLAALCETYIQNDIPVILWATINMVEAKPTNSWYLAGGTRFTWQSNEHCMLLIGFDEKNYYFNDPYSGKLVGYGKELVEDRFAAMGKQSVVIDPAAR